MRTDMLKQRHVGDHTNLKVQQLDRSIPWIWEGVIAEDAITLLSAPEKIGKTTLLSLLLDRRRGGGTLLGRTVYPGNTILCSEEHDRLWALRQPPLDFGPGLLFHRPPGDPPSRGRFRMFINDVIDLALSSPPAGIAQASTTDEEGRDTWMNLLVIDTAVHFMPLGDRNKRVLRWALSQLRQITSLPAAVLILNQSRNVHRPLAAFADIVVEMTIPRGQAASAQGGPGQGPPTRRRLFTAAGRFPGTLQTVTAELNAEGTDYMLLADSQPPHPPLLATLQTLLAASPTPLTHHELLARWPGDPPRPDTLYRTLARAWETDLFERTGYGTKNEPFRYYLPGAGKGKEQDAGQAPTGGSEAAAAKGSSEPEMIIL